MSDHRPENLTAVTDAAAVEEVAASWVRRRHFGEWGEEDQVALDSWISESLSHEVAYLRLDAAWARRLSTLPIAHDRLPRRRTIVGSQAATCP